MLLEHSMLGAIELWFKYGINPGSCTMHIILGNYEEAKMRAHPHLKEVEGGFKTIYDNHRQLLPPMCLNADWKGFDRLNSEDRNLLEFDAIMGATESYTKKWIQDMIHETNPKGDNPFYT